jgi:hypothetical protein
MSTKTSVALVFVLAITATQTADALDTIGLRQCAMWRDGRSGNAERWTQIAGEQWLAGYVSGLIRGSGTVVFETMDEDSLYRWMDSYCRANPRRTLQEGADRLYEELKAKRGLK